MIIIRPDHDELIDAIEQRDIVRVLAQIDQGVDVNAQKGLAIFRASMMGATDIVHALIDAGADIHVVDDYPLRAAVGTREIGLVKRLLSLGANPCADNDQSLAFAVSIKNAPLARVLLEGGANPNGRWGNFIERTANNGDIEILEALLAAGADPTMNKAAALMEAVFSEEPGALICAERLHAAGAKVVNEKGCLRQWLVEYAHKDVLAPLDTLVRFGLDPHHPDIDDLIRDEGKLNVQAWQQRVIMEQAMVHEIAPSRIPRASL